MGYRLALAIASFFLIGATSAGPDFTTDERCKSYAVAGTDAASNHLDICTSVSNPDQDGVDDFGVDQGNPDCNNTEVPAWLDSSRRSCYLDGFQDGLTINATVMGPASSILAWVRSTDANDTGFLTQRISGSSGRNMLFRNCGIGFIRLDWKAGGTTVFGPTCSSLWLNSWEFVGFGWNGLAGGTGRGYASVNGGSNTLLDSSGVISNDYGSPTVVHQIGRRVQTGSDIDAYFVEILHIDGDVTPCEACSICRCAAGNNHWRTNGLTGWLFDAYDMCKQCDFCSDPGELQTHCGRPRRQI